MDDVPTTPASSTLPRVEPTTPPSSTLLRVEPTAPRPGTLLHVEPQHPAFAGHFPGQPLLPGVLLLSHVLEAALAEPALAARIGDAPRLAQAKFVSPVRPGDTLAFSLLAGDRGGVRFEVRSADRLVASGQFDAAEAVR